MRSDSRNGRALDQREDDGCGKDGDVSRTDRIGGVVLTNDLPNRGHEARIKPGHVHRLFSGRVNAHTHLHVNDHAHLLRR